MTRGEMIWKRNTMRLLKGPEEIASTTRKAWDSLWFTFQFDTFHPIEGRAILMKDLKLSRSDAMRILENVVDRGFAKSP